MGIASWAPLIKMTIVKLISFGDLDLKKKKKKKKLMFRIVFLELFSIQKRFVIRSNICTSAVA